jgi:hypothetical protein
VADCCECGDGPSSSCSMELVSNIDISDCIPPNESIIN